MHIVAWVAIIIYAFAFLDWHSRMVFMARGYPRKYGHGKSWNRAHKHYKKNWTLLQRLFWIPLFKEAYTTKFKMFAYFSYAHAILCIITIVFSIVGITQFYDSKIWKCEFLIYGILSILRFLYGNAIARGKI